MYRIVCESYKKYMNDFIPNGTGDYRYQVMLPFRLILDPSLYENEKLKSSLDYKKLEDFLWVVGQNKDNYPNLKSMLWSLESRGIIGKNHGVLSDAEFSEQVKIINMFLKLAYWN
ncbi:hypothetical protein [Lutispora saccharofermentans]|uniref:Uncharacterized protein n=1 Tax=Lutispora saccharofermentans TaxID=3024236 RepID=A0ABT1ND04_9FIRM|nr:hypothetical protein [Lutispora saccharofermentans]MCQ1529135.1 hypothetical protein [Lutispora saccharofermentans]